MGGSPTDLGGSIVESAQIPGFSHTAWAVQPLTAAQNLGRRQLNRCSPVVYPKSSSLLPVISQRVPSNLPDPFGKSPSELPARSHYIVRTQPDAQA
ncbi:hypothetical protein B296_00042618 [Ensete ventricosum]|uniref:Uncharacterized protein n=1 Tax=Ensete ventricosum TaxID=4639 RepID=A0A426Y3G8_ENSVE|nr:hypothetical protein B296_00042618 [Ensete ventricosum]